MDEPIRILHVFGKLNRGGAETLIMNIYRNIDRSNVQFDFVVHGEEIGIFEEEIKKMGGNIYRVPEYRLLNHIQYKNAWRGLLKSLNNVQIIHSHIRSTATIFLKIAKKLNYQTIIHSHSTKNERNIKGLIKKILQKNITESADYLFACGKDSGRWLYGEKKDFTVIPNGIDISNFEFRKIKRDRVRKELKITNKIVFGHIGSFRKVKNHEYLINIFKESVNINKNIELLLIGDGELKEEIKNMVYKNKLEDQVKFLGVRTDVENIMQAMDVLILPSKYEGFPTVLVEAQASGLKSFVSDTITKEVNFTNEINYIDLNKDPKEWAREIFANITTVNYSRNNNVDIVRKNGYDIKDVALHLEKFYLKLVRITVINYLI